jgi:hypothetical protein
MTLSHSNLNHRVRRATPWLAAAACALLAGPVLAQKPMVILEDVLESASDLVSLPGSASGDVTARECRDCASLRLRFGKNTRYFIGKEAVAYSRFRQLADEGDVRLYVYFHPETRVLTRLRLATAPSAK